MVSPVRVALVGCGKKKLAHPAPARELYVGHLFRAHLGEALAQTAHVYVASALHGLLTLAEVREPYDVTLRSMSKLERSAWGVDVLEALARLYPAGDLELSVYAGKGYVEPLRAALTRSKRSGWSLVEPLRGASQGVRLRILAEARRARAAARNPPPASPGELQLPALEVEQRPGRLLYLFAVDGKQVPSFATVSRVKRAAGVLEGYQRPEALSHIAAIREYMESAEALVPNAVVLAFDGRVRFEALPGAVGSSRHGHLVIPRSSGPDAHDAPGFIVDGQQRLAAVREASVESFTLACTAFITDEVGPQVEQFILVNTTKPLPKGLIHELLPSTHGALPPALERKRLPALLVARLNLDEGSPLKGLIITQTCYAARGKTGKGGTAVIKDTSLMAALEASLSDGALHDLERAGATVDGMVAVLSSFWGAVATTWPDAWGKQPKDSRLAHGAGVRSVSLIMDAAFQLLRLEGTGSPTQDDFARELALVKSDCAWTSGTWAFRAGPRRWNDIQNTPKEVAALVRHLGDLYRDRRAAAAPAQPRKKPVPKSARKEGPAHG